MANSMTGSNFGEGQSVHRPPLFKGENYLYWKTRMTLYLKSTDYNVWLLVQNGDRIPSEKGIPKTQEEMNETDHNNLQLNAKALNTLFCALDVDVFNKVSACDSAKEAWDKLAITYEGTSLVKENKISMLTHEYELFSMKDNESINDMFSRFTNILNVLKSLGKVYENAEKVRKILRSLPACWDAKVTAIQEARDLTKLELDELLGSLMTHEITMKNRQQSSSKEKSIALKSKVEEEDTNESDDDEDLTMIARKFKRFFRRKKFVPNAQKGTSNKKDSVTCYECNETGHYKSECPRIKKGKEASSRFEKKKALKATTWDDSSDSDNESHEEEVANICLMANDNEVCNSSSSNPTLSHDELEENFILLLEAFDKQKKRMKDLKITNKSLVEENHFLKNEMSELQDKVSSSIASQRELSNNLEDLRKETKGPSRLLEENVTLNLQVKDLTTTLEKFTTSTKTLDILLGNQKYALDKTGVGYEPKIKSFVKTITQTSKVCECKNCGRLFKGHHKCPLKRIFMVNGKPTIKIWIIKGSRPSITNIVGPKRTWGPKAKS